MKIFSTITLLVAAASLWSNIMAHASNEVDIMKLRCQRGHQDRISGKKNMKGMRGMKGNKKGMVSSDEESVTTIFVDARPEGTTPGPTRDSVYVSEFLKGGVNLLNLKTGQSEEPVPSIEGDGPFLRGIPSLYVYDIDTGAEISACYPEETNGFINDVVLVDGYALVTDSFNPMLLRFDVESLFAGDCTMDKVPLEPAVRFTADEADPDAPLLGANVHVRIGSNGLLIATFGLASVHYIDLTTLETTMLVDGTTPNIADGVVVDGDVFYIFSNENIFVYNFVSESIRAVLLGTITSDAFEGLATAVMIKKQLVVADLTGSVEFFLGDADPTNMYKVHFVDLYYHR